MSRIRQFFKDTHRKLKDLHGRVSALKKSHDKPLEAASLPPPSPKPREKVEVVVSGVTMSKFIALVILFLLLTAFLYEIRDILIIFFVSLLFAAALDPMVDALEQRRIPRSIGVILIYAILFLAIGLLVSNIAPIIANEVASLAGKAQDFISNIVKGEIELPSYLERFRPRLKGFFEGIDVSQVGTYKDVLLNVAQNISNVAGNVFNGVLTLFNGFFNAIIVLVVTFMMTVDEGNIDNFIRSLFPARHADYIRQKSSAIKEKMGYWLRGQVTLCVIVGIGVYLGFLIIGFLTQQPVQYAATMALVAGFTELIPYVGPFLAWLIALPIVANQSVGLIVWMTVLMYVIQVLENNLIVPVVMHKAVGISPILIMFAMFVGFSFLGVLGMVLAVPVATAVALFVKDYAEKEK